MTSEQADRIGEKLDRIAEGLENLAGKKKKDDFDNAADEDSEIVNNDKEFDIVDNGTTTTVVRNSIAIELVIEAKGKDTEGYEKFRVELAKPEDIVKIGQWIGKEGATQAVASKFAMFPWHLANRSENRGQHPKTWLLKPDFGLKQKVRAIKLKNPETGKPLSAKERVRFAIAKEEMGIDDEQAVLFACGLKTAKELMRQAIPSNNNDNPAGRETKRPQETSAKRKKKNKQ